MTDATLLGGGERRPAVRLERRLADPPEDVWRALTNRDELRAWFPTDVIVEGDEWRVGAALEFPFPPEKMDLTLTGEVLEVEEPRVLSFTWGEDTLRFELTADGEGTILVLIDELPGAWAARNAAGWEYTLDRLAGLEPTRDAWQPRFEHYSALFERTLGPQDGPPAGYKGGQPERPQSSLPPADILRRRDAAVKF
jgi:uncharacterized protein YndB with AHSA1/START domain